MSANGEYSDFQGRIIADPNNLENTLDGSAATTYTVFAPLDGDFDTSDIEVSLHVFEGE
jgi:hypothetical protein